MFRSTRGKRRQAYLVCRSCPGSWVYCSRAGTAGWGTCRTCGVHWPKQQPSGHRAATFAAQGQPSNDGATAALLEQLLPKYKAARADRDEAAIQAPEVVCPALAEAVGPLPPEAPAAQFEKQAVCSRRLHAQQGELNSQLVANADHGKELVSKLLEENARSCAEAQAEASRLTSLTTAAKGATPTKHDGDRHGCSDAQIQFPELAAEDVELLAPDQKKVYEEALGHAKKAHEVYKSAADIGQQAQGAAKALREQREKATQAKRRKADVAAGVAAGAPAAPEGPAEAQVQGDACLDFSDPEKVDEFTQKTKAIESRAAAAEAAKAAACGVHLRAPKTKSTYRDALRDIPVVQRRFHGATFAFVARDLDCSMGLGEARIQEGVKRSQMGRQRHAMLLEARKEQDILQQGVLFDDEDEHLLGDRCAEACRAAPRVSEALAKRCTVWAEKAPYLQDVGRTTGASGVDAEMLQQCFIEVSSYDAVQTTGPMKGAHRYLKKNEQRALDETCLDPDTLEVCDTVSEHYRAAETRAACWKGQESFVAILNAAERWLAWSHQLLRIFVCAPPKGGESVIGNERDVGLLPMPIRIWGRRSMVMDGARARIGYNEQSNFLIGVERFNDYMDMTLMIRQATALDFPAVELHLRRATCLATRASRAQGRPLRPSCLNGSIVPGCGKANHCEGRFCAVSLGARVHGRPFASIRQHVGDVRARFERPAAMVLEQTKCVTIGLFQCVMGLGLRASPKSILAMFNPAGEIKVQKHAFKLTGIEIKGARLAEDDEPKMSAMLDQVKNWFRFWLARPPLRERVRRGWVAVPKKIISARPRARWICVVWPMGALILSLREMGSAPRALDLWVDDRGDEWQHLGGEGACGEIFQALRGSVRRERWRRAAGHSEGELVEGGGLQVLRVNLRRLRRRGCHREAGALEANALASVRAQARAKTAGYKRDDACPRCEPGRDTIAHRLCEFSANRQREHRWASRTDGLCEAAQKDPSEGRNVSSWTRGTAPPPWDPVPKSPEWNSGGPADERKQLGVLAVRAVINGRDLLACTPPLRFLSVPRARRGGEAAGAQGEGGHREADAEEEAQQLVSTFFVAFLRAGNFSASSPGDALAKVGVFQRKYKGWSEASDWLRGAVATVAGSSSLEGGLDLAGAERLAVEIGERYHAFNDMECKALKTEMEGLQVHKAGRVRLPHFYRKGLYSHWEFNEKASYLRTLGALDESEEGNTMVIMPNYLMARTNCLEATNMYALCCRNECEDLMDQLEVDVAAPEAEPKRLAELVAAMPSDTVAAPRNLSAALLSRLEEVAASNGGKVPLHGRLFAQWMHHAFPRECPYPHEHGTTSPQTPDEWMRETGEATDKMTESELLREVEADTCAWVPGEAPGAGCGDPGELPWSEAEELLTVALPEAHSRPRPLLGFAAPTHPAALGEGWDTAAAEAKAGEGTRHSGLAAVLAAALAAAAGLDRGYFGPRRRSARGLLDGEPEGAAAGALAAAWPMAEGHRVPALLCALALAAYSVELLDG
ncbi:unnamed protein product, partial [Prorocentrum cordatum]